MEASVTLAIPTLTENDARELTAKIYGHLDAAWDLIIAAYNGRAWSALGYGSWDAYCKAEFNGARLRLPREERQEVVGSLREAGLSTRAIASATGNSTKTITEDLKQVSQSTTPDEPSNVVGLDGKTYTPKPSVTDLISGEDLAELNGKPKADEPIDAEIVEDEPKPKPERRRPLTEQADTAGWEIRKSTERVVRLLEDDRLGKNKEQVALSLRGHLLFVQETVAAALHRLDGN
jgi:transposase-like protein